MQELIEQVRNAGAIGDDAEIAEYLTNLRYSGAVSNAEASELALDFNKVQSQSHGKMVALPTQKAVTNTKRSGKGRSKQTKIDTLQATQSLLSAEVDSAREIVEQSEQFAQQLTYGVLNAVENSFEKMDQSIADGLAAMMEDRATSATTFRQDAQSLLRGFRESVGMDSGENG